MRFVTIVTLAAVLAAPALVHTAQAQPAPAHAAAKHPMRHHAPAKHQSARPPRANAEDNGPFTPEANRAYNGGGVVTEGAPGSAPPMR